MDVSESISLFVLVSDVTALVLRKELKVHKLLYQLSIKAYLTASAPFKIIIIF